jgi:hypothetical protein
MMGYIFSNVLLQLLYVIGSIFIIGFIINLLNKAFYRTTRYHGLAIYGTGFIGTPIHELSHAAMCLLFGHHIEESKLFQIDRDTGTLGYVVHSYNKKNLWAVMGNYFIGIAPIACGAVVLFFGIKLLIPETFAVVSGELEAFSVYISGGASWDWLPKLWELFVNFLSALFTESLSTYKWWIFIFLAMCIALHMNLSGADIKGALPSLPIVAAVVIILNLIFGLLSESLYAHFLRLANRLGGYIIGILLLSVTLSLFYVALAWIIKYMIVGLRKIIFRR